MRESETAQGRVVDLESRLAGAESVSAELQAMRTELDEVVAARRAAEDEVAEIENEMAELRQTNVDQEGELDRQYEQIEQLSQRVQEIERGASAAVSSRRLAEESLMIQITRLRLTLQETEDTLAEKEAELETTLAKLASQTLGEIITTMSSPDCQGVEVNAENPAGMVQAMEEQLDNAFREIGRLKHELSATPHHKASIEVQDTRIKALEREKAVLTERLALARTASISPAPLGGLQTAGSPFNRPTPFVHKAIASLRTPKTPGPLKDVSRVPRIGQSLKASAVMASNNPRRCQ